MSAQAISAVDTPFKSNGASHPEGLILDRCTQEQAFDLFYTWAVQEQWNPSVKGQDIRDLYHKADPEGFFYGRIADKQAPTKTEIVSIVSLIRYGKDQAWLGFYIVLPRHRGKGYGMATFQKALEHAGHDRQSIGLDGVLAQVENYKKSGFTNVAWRNERRHGSAKDLVENLERDLAEKVARGGVPGLVHLSDDLVDWDQVQALEQRYAGLKRPEFIKEWAQFHTFNPELHRFGVAVLSTDGTVDEKSGKPKILGFGCVRPAETSYRVGPLYASTPEVAKLLLVKLGVEVVQAERQSPYHVPLQFDVDVPTSNEEAVKLFDGLDWKDTFPSLRMWRGKIPEHDVNGIFAVATLEVG